MDFTGPVYVKNVFGGETKMRKVYITLNTCASTRAVHLDLVLALDAVFHEKFKEIVRSERGESVVHFRQCEDFQKSRCPKVCQQLRN